MLRKHLQFIAGHRDPSLPGRRHVAGCLHQRETHQQHRYPHELARRANRRRWTVQDYNNLAGEKSLSSQDVSQRLIISYVLDLPFGHGKRLSGATGARTKWYPVGDLTA